MTAGLNLKVKVWRMNEDDDDVVGGAMITGSAVYFNVNAALTPRRPSQIMLEQGLETDAIYDMTTSARSDTRGYVTLFERDEVEVVHPQGHPLYGLRFRIIGVQPSKRRPRYGHQHATLSRIRESRSQQ